MQSPATAATAFAILIAVVVGAFAYVSANPIIIPGGPWMGIRGAPLTPELADAAGYPGQQGFLIEVVEDNSPAQQAGLKGGNRLETVSGNQHCLGGDLIVGMNGRPVTGIDEIRQRIENSQPKDTIAFRVLRVNSTQLALIVTLGEDPGQRPKPLEEVCS